MPADCLNCRQDGASVIPPNTVTCKHIPLYIRGPTQPAQPLQLTREEMSRAADSCGYYEPPQGEES